MEGLRRLNAAAAKDHPEAMNRLGHILLAGKIANKDTLEAARLFTRAAEAGHAPSMVEIGVLYYNGTGVQADPSEQVLRLAALARESGLDGVICSPLEIAALRKACGRDFVLMVPGIRPPGTASADQKRVMTPGEAVRLGANHLVIGRPITEAADPASAAEAIARDLGAR